MKGEVYSWGSGLYGELGNNAKKNEKHPKLIEFFGEKNIKIVKIEAGDHFSAVISSSYELFTFGCGNFYRLGHGVLIDEIIPKKVENLNDLYVTDASCGFNHMICLTNEGHVYTWGNGKYG